MDSKVDDLLEFDFKPIVLIKTDEKPENAIGPKSNRGHGCVMTFIGRTIKDRIPSVFEKDTISCFGAIVGLGFGNGYKESDMGLECFASFLSTGLKDAEDKERYGKIINMRPPQGRRMFEEGERIYSSYERAKNFMQNKVPYYENTEKYVVFKPLEDVDENEDVESVIFTLNPLELSVLISFDTSLRDEFGYVMTPPSAACQSIGNFVFLEAEKEDPHGILGLIDLAGRNAMRPPLKTDYFTFAVPWKLFKKYEENAEYSYLDGAVWENMKNNLKEN